jgi:hypothetical protein
MPSAWLRIADVAIPPSPTKSVPATVWMVYDCATSEAIMQVNAVQNLAQAGEKNFENVTGN